MAVSVKTLIGQLPPYQDQWILLKESQVVKDIIHAVLEYHEQFAPHYDKIALYFDGKNAAAVCDNIYSFIKDNIKYEEEGEDDQTTALPAGILTRLKGDCKHYSSFCAGILDALNRAGKKFDWCYCFASYKYLDKTPHHVFIKVFDKGKELWFDPTPNANNLEPVWMIDKKISGMPLRANIAGVDYIDFTDTGSIGANWQMYANKKTTYRADKYGNGPANPYFVGIPFLGLEFYYEDNLSIDGNNWQITTDSINNEVKNGPSPGHTFTVDFVKWIYGTNTKGWNFYWPMGAPVGFVPNLPADYPKLVITDDGRLNLDRDMRIHRGPDHPEIYAITAWAQSLINEYDPSPYPVKPQHLTEFSEKLYGGPDTRNLFTERRGESFFKKVAETISKAVTVLKDGWLKIVGSVPRNAFLAMVGLNLFHIANKLQQAINDGKWEAMASKWRSLGGNPDKLLGTIEDGNSKNPITDENAEVIGEPITAATIMALAAPIIAIMLKFVKDPDGKLKTVLSATKTALQAAFPDVDFSAFAFLDTDTGQELQFQIDAIDDENQGGGNDSLTFDNDDILSSLKKTLMDNPIPTAAAAGLLVHLFVNKKGKKPNYILPIAAAAGAYFMINNANQ